MLLLLENDIKCLHVFKLCATVKQYQILRTYEKVKKKTRAGRKSLIINLPEEDGERDGEPGRE